MDSKALKTIFEIGETIAVEFKRCGNKIESDVYEVFLQKEKYIQRQIIMEGKGIRGAVCQMGNF